ncbi:hypothetical protein BHE74_00010650 [Ensete ventricosum]|nr:hypothetical protein BHE74_00010650 [Ensete ventricosum]
MRSRRRDDEGDRLFRCSSRRLPQSPRLQILLFTTLLVVTSWIGIVRGGRHRIEIEKGHGNKFAPRFSRFSLFFERPLLPSSTLLPQPRRSQVPARLIPPDEEKPRQRRLGLLFSSSPQKKRRPRRRSCHPARFSSYAAVPRFFGCKHLPLSCRSYRAATVEIDHYRPVSSNDGVETTLYRPIQGYVKGTARVRNDRPCL